MKKLSVWFREVMGLLFWGFLLVIAISGLFTGSNSVIKNLTSDCVIYTVEDLEKCYNENQYVEVHTMQVLDGGYEHIEDNNGTGKFVIINLDGHGMISLLKESLADSLLTNEIEQVVIKGKIEKFSQSNKTVSDNIEKQYKEAFKDVHTEEELATLFTAIQFNQYDADKGTLIFLLVFYIAAIIWFLSRIIRKIPGVIKPEQYHFNNSVSIREKPDFNKVLEEFDSKKYYFQYKNIYITEHYLIKKRGKRLHVTSKDCIAWIYEKKVTVNFITYSHYIVVHTFDRKRALRITVNEKNKTFIMEALRKECPNATFGYNYSLASLWRKNPERFIKNNE